MDWDNSFLLSLNMKYLIEILCSEETDEGKALKCLDIRHEVFSKVMCLRNKISAKSFKWETENNEVNLLFAKFISIIGVGDFMSIRPWVKDHSYSNNEDLNKEGEVWDDELCVIEKEFIKINRKDSVEFLAWIYKSLIELFDSTDRSPNSILFCIWQLECLLIEYGHTKIDQLELQVEKNQAKTLQKLLDCSYKIEQLKDKRSDEYDFSHFWASMITLMQNEDFRQIFTVLYNLIITKDYN